MRSSVACAFILSLFAASTYQEDDYCVPGFEKCCGTAIGKYEEACKGHELESCTKCCSGRNIPIVDRRKNPPTSRCCVRDGAHCCNSKPGNCYAADTDIPHCSYCCNKMTNFPCTNTFPPICFCAGVPPAKIRDTFYPTRKLADAYLTKKGKKTEDERIAAAKNPPRPKPDYDAIRNGFDEAFNCQCSKYRRECMFTPKPWP